jgi:hypothetical protein
MEDIQSVTISIDDAAKELKVSVKLVFINTIRNKCKGITAILMYLNKTWIDEKNDLLLSELCDRLLKILLLSREWLWDIHAISQVRSHFYHPPKNPWREGCFFCRSV